MGAGVAHFYTSYMFPDDQAPRYYAGGGVMSGACLVCAGLALFIKRYLKKQNKRFEEEEAAGQVSHSQIKGARGDNAGNAVVAFRYVH